MIRFRCKECGKKLKAGGDIIGRKVKCTRCESIETVPASDNLAKPNRPKIRLATNKPKPTQFKSVSDGGASKTVNLDQPVELFGHSASGSMPTESFEPRFSVSAPRNFQLRRWVLIGLVGVFVVAAIAVVMNLGWIMDARKRFSTDYENLTEVVYYRNQVMKLEKSRRMMHIAGLNFIKTKLGTDEDLQELETYNASIQALTTESDIIEKVEAHYRSGEDVLAAALLVNSGRELVARRKEVEFRTRQYQNQTDVP